MTRNRMCHLVVMLTLAAVQVWAPSQVLGLPNGQGTASSGRESHRVERPAERLRDLEREWRARRGAGALARQLSLFDDDAPRSRVLVASRLDLGAFTPPTLGLQAAPGPGLTTSGDRTQQVGWLGEDDPALREELARVRKQVERECSTGRGTPAGEGASTEARDQVRPGGRR